MTSSERDRSGATVWRLGETARVGWLGYLADNPPRVVFWAVGVRGVLQAAFFVLLGTRLVGGFGPTGAYLGALAILMTGPNVIGVANVPLTDKLSGTFWRLRRAVVAPVALLVVRALPYPVVATVVLVPQAVVVALVLGRPDGWWEFLPCLPLFALMAATTAVMGLAAAALSVSKRADVLAPNLVSYLVLLGSGAVVPPGRLAWLDAMGTVLPGRHALAAVRHAVAGRSWWADAAGEVMTPDKPHRMMVNL